MAAQAHITALNLGMQTISLADFHVLPNGGLSLNAYHQAELIVDPSADATRPGQIAQVVKELCQSAHLKPKQPVYCCLPSQSVFTRFVKLPGSSPDDVASIIGFEAQQNVPFPIDEVVWDYQILGNAKNGNWEIVLVAMKADQLGEINEAVSQSKLRTVLIDVAPMAIYNAFRYNYPDTSGCSLVVDIGARTTNLIFIDDDRAFSRSIPLGGNAISAAIAKEFGADITLAERMKVEKGFVGLGGAYAEPSDPTEARIAKVIRNTMTRLHAEIARSISFYRANQGGNQPLRVYLCGGTVSLSYMPEFFSEKLQLPVEFLNPLRNVTVGNDTVAQTLSNKTHTLAELVGTALRAQGNCPAEISLRPISLVREQTLARRKPFLVVSVICLVLILAAWWLFLYQATAITQAETQVVQGEVGKLDTVAQQIDTVTAKEKDQEAIAAPLQALADQRSIWASILNELGAKLPPRFIWITSLEPVVDGKPLTMFQGQPNAPQNPGFQHSEPSPSRRGATGEITALNITGLYLDDPPNSKQARIIDEYVDNLQKSDLFAIPDKAKAVTTRITPTGESWAYGYEIRLPLRNPIPLQ